MINLVLMAVGKSKDDKWGNYYYFEFASDKFPDFYGILTITNQDVEWKVVGKSQYTDLYEKMAMPYSGARLFAPYVGCIIKPVASFKDAIRIARGETGGEFIRSKFWKRQCRRFLNDVL